MAVFRDRLVLRRGQTHASATARPAVVSAGPSLRTMYFLRRQVRG